MQKCRQGLRGNRFGGERMPPRAAKFLSSEIPLIAKFLELG